jgi:hypothetical protein
VLDKAQAVVSEVIAAGVVAVVNSDVAVAGNGSGCKREGWGRWGGVGGGMGRRWRLWSWQESSVKQTTRSSERVCA